MKVCKLKRIPGSKTLQWRTMEGNKGQYYTYANGKGILYMNDSKTFGIKFCTHEKFQACKTLSGTRKKLNKLFLPLSDDPTPENEYHL